MIDIVNQYIYSKLSKMGSLQHMSIDYIFQGNIPDYHNYDNDTLYYRNTYADFNYSLDDDYYNQFNLKIRIYSKNSDRISEYHSNIQYILDNINSIYIDFNYVNASTGFDEVNDAHFVEINYNITYVGTT